MWVKMFWERFLHGYLQGADKEHIERWGAVIDAKVAEMVRRDHRRAARKDAACASH